MPDDNFPDDADAPRMTARELLNTIARDAKAIRVDMASVKKTLFGEDDKVGLVARVIALEKEVGQLTALLRWAGAALAAAVGGLLWAIFTGRVQLVNIP
jgi:hypothetical protein